MSGREYYEFLANACLAGMPHEDDPDYEWKIHIYRAGYRAIRANVGKPSGPGDGMEAIKATTRVPSGPGSSESSSDDDPSSSESSHEPSARNGDVHYPKICCLFLL